MPMRAARESRKARRRLCADKGIQGQSHASRASLPSTTHTHDRPEDT